MENKKNATGLGQSFNATGDTQPAGGMGPATGPVAPTVITTPPGTTQEGPSQVNVHPVSVELKHILVFGLLFLIAGIGLGYWEMKKTNGGGGVIAGFGAAGLAIGLAIGCALPARKKHRVLSATGKEEFYFTEN